MNDRHIELRYLLVVLFIAAIAAILALSIAEEAQLRISNIFISVLHDVGSLQEGVADARRYLTTWMLPLTNGTLLAIVLGISGAFSVAAIVDCWRRYHYLLWSCVTLLWTVSIFQLMLAILSMLVNSTLPTQSPLHISNVYIYPAGIAEFGHLAAQIEIGLGITFVIIAFLLSLILNKKPRQE